ncbi:MAG: GntR family transcriptional regulator [Anaerolineae bacterium]
MPRYYQIKQNLIDLIQSNLLRAGDALPSERELGELYNVNRMTVRQAITELTTQGVLRRLHGVGTFVTERTIIAPIVPAIIGFSERTRNAGQKPTSRVLSLELVPGSPFITEKLELDQKAPLILLRRLRLIDDEPLMIESSYLSYTAFPDLMEEDFNQQSLYYLLAARYNTPIIETDHTFEPTLLTPEESGYFDLKGGQPAMLVHMVAYTTNRQPTEFCKSVIRGDRCRYYFTANTQSPMTVH